MISQKVYIEKFYNLINIIAKKGKDNYLEYYAFFDLQAKTGNYNQLRQTLYYKYNFDILDLDTTTAKERSWKCICFLTTSNLQDLKYNALNQYGVYQIGLNYFKKTPSILAYISATSGSGCILQPIITDGLVTKINVLNPGNNYLTASIITVVITGGLTAASASAVVKVNKIFSVTVTEPGYGYNQDILLGTITENDIYVDPIPNFEISSNSFQIKSKNKQVFFTATKNNSPTGMTFGTWDSCLRYSENYMIGYTASITYLLSGLI